MVAHADAPVLAAVAQEMVAARSPCSPPLGLDVVGVDVAAHRDVLIAWPMSCSYLMTVSPLAIGRIATLWPSGTSASPARSTVASLAITQPELLAGLASSTTTTPTVSSALWTMKCGFSVTFLLPRPLGLRGHARIRATFTAAGRPSRPRPRRGRERESARTFRQRRVSTQSSAPKAPSCSSRSAWRRSSSL